jgi:type II secretory ATPase GspE/PulE/Tfp pilus assembly ATPase PilB-like protein
MAVFELLEVNDAIQELIVTDASESDIRKSAAYRTMLDDSLDKLSQGLTDVEEILRVVVV